MQIEVPCTVATLPPKRTTPGGEPTISSPVMPERAALDECLFRSRVITVFGEIKETLAEDVVRRLLALDAESREPIQMWVCSPGGHLESGDAIHDVVRFIDAPVYMIGSGWVGSAATHLYLAADRTRRFCLPQTRFLIHQPSGGAGGPATDVSIQAREIIRARERIARTIAEQTDQPLDTVMLDIERDRWLSASEAVQYGLLACVITRRSDLPQPAATQREPS